MLKSGTVATKMKLLNFWPGVPKMIATPRVLNFSELNQAVRKVVAGKE